MRRQIAFILHTCGCPVLLRDSEERTCEVQALIQPVRARSLNNAYRSWGPVGELPPGQLVMLTQDSPRGFVEVEQDGLRYRLRHWEPFRMRGEVLYYWALLTPEGEPG